MLMMIFLSQLTVRPRKTSPAGGFPCGTLHIWYWAKWSLRWFPARLRPTPTFSPGNSQQAHCRSPSEFRVWILGDWGLGIGDFNFWMVNWQHLYQEGARTFWIHNTGPIGCLPVAVMYIRNPPPGMLDQYGCNKAQNEIAMEFNKQLENGLMKLRGQLPEAAITYVDLYAAKYGLISDAKGQGEFLFHSLKQYCFKNDWTENDTGFVDPLKVCCGVRVNDYNVWCGQKAMINGTEVYGHSCANPSAYISWDGVHYSQAANHWFANHILNGSLSDSSLPISQACHRPRHFWSSISFTTWNRVYRCWV